VSEAVPAESGSSPVSDRVVLMMISKAISHGCFLLIAVVLAHALTLKDFGTFNQVWLVNKSLFYLFSLGLPVSVYFFLPRLAASERKSFIAQTMLGLTVLALPFSIAMYLLATPLAGYFHNPDLAHQLRLFAIWPLVTVPTVCTDAILLSLSQTGKAAAFEIVTKLGMIAAVAGAAFSGRGLATVFVALIVYGVLQSLLAIWMVWLPVRGTAGEITLTGWRSQLAYAAPYGLGTLAAVLNYQVDKVVVSLFYPPETFALYAAGAFEIPLAGVTSVVVLSVIMPEFVKRYQSQDVEGFLTLWHHSMLKLALPIFAVAGFLMVFASPVVKIAFSAQYAESAWPFRIYLLFLPLRITVWSQILAATGDTGTVLKAQLKAMALNVILGYALIRSVGWMGGAVAALLADYVFSVLLLRQVGRRLQVGVRRMVPWVGLFRVAVLAVVASLICLPILPLGLPVAWELLIGFALFTTVYALAALKADLITGDDILTVRRWLTLGSGLPLSKAL